jgi:zinc-binding alcohol dehydrogenase/oxidoreductase
MKTSIQPPFTSFNPLLMKAWILSAASQPIALQSADLPAMPAGHARVRIHATALNHRDVWISKGQYAGIQYPIILGSDGAGIVEAVGQAADNAWINQAVLINPSFNWGADEACQGDQFEILGLPQNGTLAEYVAVPVDYLHLKPAHLSMAQAAALPLAGLTAFRALVSRARVQPGEHVLVTGIGGGVALFALQFALAIGCKVWVTSGDDNKIRAAVALGAQGGVNYRQPNWRKDLQAQSGPIDVVIDGAGGPGFAELMNIAAPGARIAIYGGTAGNLDGLSPQRIFWKQISILGSTMGSAADFHNMLRFVDRYGIIPVIDEIFPFEEADQAFQKMSEGKQFGKLVIDVCP